jgi:hypothetical protein
MEFGAMASSRREESAQLLVVCQNDLLVPEDGLTFNISARIQNSPTIKSAIQVTSIKAYTIYPLNDFPIEMGIAESQFKVDLIHIFNLTMELLWGVKYGGTYAVPVTLFKPAVTTPKGYPYNNVKVNFMLTNSTPASTELQISVGVG